MCYFLTRTATNIDMAVRACREEKSSLFNSNIREEMKPVKESIDDKYCDASGQAIDLVLSGRSIHHASSEGGSHQCIGEMGGIKVFMSRGPSHHGRLHCTTNNTLLQTYHSLERCSKRRSSRSHASSTL